MLDGLFMLLSLSTLMAIASFLAGSLPLSFSLSQSQLRVISIVGMGVLVGTSLIVIIPEGVETLYSADRVDSHSHARRQLPLAGRDVILQQRSTLRRDASTPPDRRRSPVEEIPTYEEYVAAILGRRSPDDRDAFNALPGPVLPEGLIADALANDPPKTPTEPGEVSILSDTNPLKSEEDAHGHNPHAWIGVSLVLGFILMYLIDTLPSLAPTAPPPRPGVYSLDDLSGSSGPSIPPPSSPSSRSFSTTIGLVIHAAADGIALGASSTQPSLSFIIFLAIMIHKAPAAFGLTSVLLSQGLGKRAARAHLVIFSLAAPLGALGAWTIIRVLGGTRTSSPTEEETMQWWTGVLLLFSGGTFLYVAMHTMQDTAPSSHSHSSLSSHHGHSHSFSSHETNGFLDGPHGYTGTGDLGRGGKEGGMTLKLTLAAVAGMLLPLVTQVGHVH
ncbi:MAG: hypothetical protein MMC33_002661 [Icmadophila ericetorum]|nr:hypothetical protein [Icmadophila ericetorum]